MTAEEREGLFGQMLELPNELKSELLVAAWVALDRNDPEDPEIFFEHVEYVIDQYLEGKLDK